jgi:DNA modification methylase
MLSIKYPLCHGKQRFDHPTCHRTNDLVSSLGGDLVLDTFAGTGTTAHAFY